jgi:outer membrane scaffolding protein for murein synthesis (MipA/OmpV family)
LSLAKPSTLYAVALAGYVLCLSGAQAEDSLGFGAGVNSDAAYLGSAITKTSLVPLWDVERAVGGAPNSLYFARVSRGYPEAGIQTKLGPLVSAGIQIGYEPGRKLQDFSSRLQTMGVAAFGDGVGIGFHVEASGQWGSAPMSLIARFRQRTPAQHGMLLDFRYDVGVFEKGAFGLGLNAQAIWANANAMQTDFGVTAAQAAAIGAQAFNAQSGWQSTALGATAQYDISSKLQWFAALKRQQLGAGAASSPITESRMSSGLATGFIWKF